jgi:putative transposase
MAQGLKRDKVLAICGISKNAFYYKPKGGKPGRKPSDYTFQQSGDELVKRSNRFVKDYMESLFDNPLTDYGYHRMTGALQLAGFYINHKKVYRLMKSARLLQPVLSKTPKAYVKYRVLCPDGALRLMEMDIKQIWVEGLRRHVYVLTILDVFTRCVLYWEVGLGIRQQQVQSAWQLLIEEYLEPARALAWEMHIEIRSDNGPQFCAEKLRQFLQDNYFVQTFTHPYTPQENGHVESFHAILAKALRGEYFEHLPAVRNWLECFYQNYNYLRIHGSTCYLPPMTFWEQWKTGNIERMLISEKERKVRFSLKVPRQQIQKVEPAGNGSRREVSSLNWRGLDAPSNSFLTQADGPVLIAEPAVQRSPSVVSSQEQR